MNSRSDIFCSVCIANYNGEGYLRDCLDSVLSQDFDKPIEIIVHDDASTDGSVELLKKNYPDVIIIENNKNSGFCVSNNRMVAIARGEFVLLLNNDAKLRKDAINTLHKASIENGSGIYGLPQYDSQSGALIDMGSMLDPFLNPIPNLDSKCQDVGMIIGACLWIPKRLWDSLGGFPDWFGSLAEDMYLCCLARLRGFSVSVVPASGFDHWVGGSLGGGKVLPGKKLSTTQRRRAISERNKSFVMIMCCPSPLVCFLLPISLLLLCIEGTVLSFVKMDSRLWSQIYLNCLKELWNARYKLIRKRHLLQMTRQCSRVGFFKPFKWVPHKLRMLMKYGLPNISN